MEEANQLNNQAQAKDEHNESVLCQALSSSAYTVPANVNRIKVKMYRMKHNLVNSMAEYSTSLNKKYTKYITSLNALSETSGSTELIDKFIKIQERLQSAIKGNLKLMSDFFDKAFIKDVNPDELAQIVEKNVNEPNILQEVDAFVKAKNGLQGQLPVDLPKEMDKPIVKKESTKEIALPPINVPVKPQEINPMPVQPIAKAVVEPKPEPKEPQQPPKEIIKQEEVDDNYNFVSGDLIKFQVSKAADIQQKQDELNEVAQKIRKLKLSNLSCENLNTLFKIKSSLNETTSCTIKRSSFDNPNLRKFMPNLLYLKLSSIYTHLSAYNYFIVFPKLKELRLNGVNLQNKSFKALMSLIFSQTNDEMAGNLKVLSLKNNKINSVSLTVPPGKLEKLRLLDFEHNKLHTFSIESFTHLPSLQAIDLSSNDFLYNNAFEDLVKRATEDNCKADIMIGGSPFLIKDKSRERYIQYLKQTLSKKSKAEGYALPSLTFSYLFNKNNKSTLSTDFVGYNIWNNLNELNLVSCQLKNEDLLKLLLPESNTFAALNKLNVASNEIDDDIFRIINEKAAGKFKKIKELDFSHTLVKGNNKSMVPFIKNLNRLKKMKIYSTPFEDTFCLFLRGLVETMKKLDPKDKPLTFKSEIEIAMNEFNTLFSTFDKIGSIKMKICLQVASSTVCRKLQKTPPDCGKYFDIKE